MEQWVPLVYNLDDQDHRGRPRVIYHLIGSDVPSGQSFDLPQTQTVTSAVTHSFTMGVFVTVRYTSIWAPLLMVPTSLVSTNSPLQDVGF